MVLEFNSRTIGKRDRAPRLMAREPAWRLNAHRSFSMTDGIIPMIVELSSRTIGKRDRAPRLMARKPAWRLNAHKSFIMTDVSVNVPPHFNGDAGHPVLPAADLHRRPSFLGQNLFCNIKAVLSVCFLFRIEIRVADILVKPC